MPKKLLMNNHSENGLTPVTDGLICWLDGRDGKGTDTVWVDRSKNGNDFTLNGFTFTGDNGWTGRNLKTNFHEYAISKISLATEYTIEVDLFVDGVERGKQSTFFYFGDGNASGQWRETFLRRNSATDNTLSVCNASHQKLIGDIAYKKYHLVLMGSQNRTCSYVESVKIYDVTRNNINSNFKANFYLGCGWNLGNFSQARFNSVKIYNRVLTEEEIQQNYLYEKSIERG